MAGVGSGGLEKSELIASPSLREVVPQCVKSGLAAGKANEAKQAGAEKKEGLRFGDGGYVASRFSFLLCGGVVFLAGDGDGRRHGFRNHGVEAGVVDGDGRGAVESADEFSGKGIFGREDERDVVEAEVRICIGMGGCSGEEDLEANRAWTVEYIVAWGVGAEDGESGNGIGGISGEVIGEGEDTGDEDRIIAEVGHRAVDDAGLAFCNCGVVAHADDVGTAVGRAKN